MLSVERVTKCYGNLTVLEDISLDLAQGVYGLLAPNGAGKSTLMKMLATLLFPTKGRILWDGEEIVAMGERYRGLLGYLPQDFGYYPNSTPRQFMRYAAALQKIPRAETDRRIIRLLELVGITDAEKRMKNYPHQLSGGMRQRVMIAIALACEPKLLIADEPTTALDVTIQAQILELMMELKDKLGMAIIMITHDLGVVASMCERIAVMYAGRIIEYGSTDDIFYHPKHEYTKGLIRAIPRLDTKEHERLVPIEGTPVDMLNPPAGCPFAPRCDAAMQICLR